jgi:hypothetical protein
VQTRSNRPHVVVGAICCIAWSAGITAGCELDNTGTPQIIAGPSVPSPVPLHAPYVWDTQEELKVWTENAVSHGRFSIDDEDSNGAIAIQITNVMGDNVVLRGPDIEPAARSIRAVRVRYQWLPSDTVSSPGFGLFVAFSGANAPGGGLHPRARATLKSGPGWKESESGVPVEYPELMPLDVRYLYFCGFTQNPGLLKIDTITLVN